MGGGGWYKNIIEIFLSQVEMRMLMLIWMLMFLLTLNMIITVNSNVIGNSDVKDNGMVMIVVVVYINNNIMEL